MTSAPSPQAPQAQGVAARLAAWRAVRRVHERTAWSGPAIDKTLRAAADLDARDRAFAANLAYETLRWEGTLDWALSHVITRGTAAVEAPLLDVVRVAAWELLRGGTPDRAAVAAAVEVARRAVGERATGFTNGVLRALARRRETLPWPDRDTDDGLGLALGYPGWIVAEARATFGDRAEAVLAAGNVAPGVTLRASDPGVADELRAAGLDPQPGRLAPEVLRVPGADPGRLMAVAEGRAVVQDEASTVVGHVAAAGLPPDARAVDLCAAPGGKATHLAQLGLRVVAGDLRPGRAAQVVTLAQRLRLNDRLRVAVWDATSPPLRHAAFDLVLLDAPCSGLGVVRRRPELRWRRAPEDVAALAALQARLLDAAAELVAPGGRLCYSACTWTLAETVQLTHLFLAKHPLEFRQEKHAIPGIGSPASLGMQLAPDADGTDGMFVVALRRAGERRG